MGPMVRGEWVARLEEGAAEAHGTLEIQGSNFYSECGEKQLQCLYFR